MLRIRSFLSGSVVALMLGSLACSSGSISVNDDSEGQAGEEAVAGNEARGGDAPSTTDQGGEGNQGEAGGNPGATGGQTTDTIFGGTGGGPSGGLGGTGGTPDSGGTGPSGGTSLQTGGGTGGGGTGGVTGGDSGSGSGGTGGDAETGGKGGNDDSGGTGNSDSGGTGNNGTDGGGGGDDRVCRPGFGDCNGDAADACETNLRTVTNCGDCDSVCEFSHATPACEGGECVLESCEDGWGDCDEDPANGCETEVNASPDHCGACGSACGDAQTCEGGECACEEGSPCGTECLDLATDHANCGECGQACGDEQACTEGQCTCEDGDICGRECVDLATDVENCGECSNACEEGDVCFEGQCAGGPCDGLCDNAVPNNPVREEGVDVEGWEDDGYRIFNGGSDLSACYEVLGYEPTETPPRIVCWGGSGPLRVNGEDVSCTDQYGVEINDPRVGGYCVEVLGDVEGILLPTVAHEG